MHVDLLRSFIVQEGATVVDSIAAVPIAEMGGGFGVLLKRRFLQALSLSPFPCR